MNLMDQSQAVGLGEPLTTEQNDALYQRLVSGDMKARDEMIEGNLALVVYRVDAYIRCAPQMAYYRDDLISGGLEGLCKAVDAMSQGKHLESPRPTGRITKAIDRHISNLADEANVVCVPRRTQTRARAKGKPIDPPRVVSDKILQSKEDQKYFEEKAAIELQEEILACCQTDVERQIILMRIEGYNDTEIGEKINRSQQYISSVRARLFSRFSERCPEYKETERMKAKRASKHD